MPPNRTGIFHTSMTLTRLTGVAVITLMASACAVYDGPAYHSWYGTYNPSVANGYKGLIAYEPGADYVAFMIKQCSPYGGLDNSSIRDGRAEKMIGNNLGFVKEYRCRGLTERAIERGQVLPAVGSNKTSDDGPVSSENLKAARKKCADLGLKPGTEKFGECVLKLSRGG